MSLVVNRADEISFGQLFLCFLQHFLYAYGHIHYITVGNCGNSQTDGGLVVEIHGVSGCSAVRLMNLGNVCQPVGGTVFSGNGQLADFFQIAEHAPRVDTDPVGRGLYAAGIHYLVLLFKGLSYLSQCDAGLRQNRRIHLKFDGRSGQTEDFHPCHILHAEQFVFKLFGFFVHVAVRMGGTAQSVEHAQHVSEIIIHNRRTGSFGQLILHIVYLAAQLVPQLLHLVGADFFLYVNRNFGHSGPVVAFQIIQFAERLYGFLQLVRDLFLHFLGRGSGIRRGHHCLLDGERSVFQFAHLHIRQNSSNQEQTKNQPAESLVVQKIFG